jgi:hypothetical protein
MVTTHTLFLSFTWVLESFPVEIIAGAICEISLERVALLNVEDAGLAL